MQTNLTAKRGAGSITKAETKSLNAAYVRAEKINAQHELFTHPAFYSTRETKRGKLVWPRKLTTKSFFDQELRPCVCVMSGNQTFDGHLSYLHVRRCIITWSHS